MLRFERSVVIRRPLDEVFAFLSDFANDAQWSGAVKEARQTSEGPVGVGTAVQQINEFMGRRVETRGVVTAFESRRSVCYRSEGAPIPHHECRRFEQLPEGTRFTLVMEAELTGVFRLAEGMARSAGERQLDADLATLVRLLEGGEQALRAASPDRTPPAR